MKSILTEEQWKIIEERKARYESGLSKGYTWEEVNKRLTPNKRKKNRKQ